MQTVIHQPCALVHPQVVSTPQDGSSTQTSLSSHQIRSPGKSSRESAQVCSALARSRNLPNHLRDAIVAEDVFCIVELSRLVIAERSTLFDDDCTSVQQGGTDVKEIAEKTHSAFPCFELAIWRRRCYSVDLRDRSRVQRLCESWQPRRDKRGKRSAPICMAAQSVAQDCSEVCRSMPPPDEMSRIEPAGRSEAMRVERPHAQPGLAEGGFMCPCARYSALLEPPWVVRMDLCKTMSE